MNLCTQSFLPPVLTKHPHILLPTAALIFFLPIFKFPVAPQCLVPCEFSGPGPAFLASHTLPVVTADARESLKKP